jgi:hypothetical protein
VQGKPDVRLNLAVTEARTFDVLFAYEAAGASWHPVFPAPSDVVGAARVEAKPRAHRAAGIFVLFEKNCSSFRGARSASPESITTTGSMDSGPAPSAHPGMTITKTLQKSAKTITRSAACASPVVS